MSWRFPASCRSSRLCPPLDTTSRFAGPDIFHKPAPVAVTYRLERGAADDSSAESPVTRSASSQTSRSRGTNDIPTDALSGWPRAERRFHRMHATANQSPDRSSACNRSEFALSLRHSRIRMPESAVLGARISVEDFADTLRGKFVFFLLRLFVKDQQKISRKHVIE